MSRLAARLFLAAAFSLSFSALAFAQTLYVQGRTPAGQQILKVENGAFTPLAGPNANVSELFPTSDGRLIIHYMEAQSGGWDWFELIPATGKQRAIAKSSWFSKGFLDVMPYPRADGSYLGKVILPNGIQIYSLHPNKGPQVYLSVPGLYGAAVLPDGSILYVTSGGGQESEDFADYFVGRKMGLWHKSVHGKTRKLGDFDTVHGLHVAHNGKGAIFYNVGKKTGPQTTWKLTYIDLGSGKTRIVTEIPNLERTIPQTAAWMDVDWMVYGSYVRDNAPEYDYYRVNLTTGQSTKWMEGDDFLTYRSSGMHGHLVKFVYVDDDHHGLEVWDVGSGLRVSDVQFRWRDYSMMKAAVLWP